VHIVLDGECKPAADIVGESAGALLALVVVVGALN
jgi:hypothetical protein